MKQGDQKRQGGIIASWHRNQGMNAASEEREQHVTWVQPERPRVLRLFCRRDPVDYGLIEDLTASGPRVA
ncbi:hypothetical protein MRX96_018331 [Rhipicephalus microplus]